MEAIPPLISLPRELQDAIALLCDRSSLDALTLVSRSCREIFACYRFKRVHFRASPSKFTLLPNYLFENGDKAKVDIHKYVHVAGPAKTWHDPDRDMKLPYRIVRSVELMKNLRELRLEIAGLPETQKEAFRSFLCNGPWWRVSSLVIAASSSIVSAAITACHPGTIETLQVPSSVLEGHSYHRMAKSQPQLQRLLFNARKLNREETETEMGLSVRFNTGHLKNLWEDFKHLNCFVMPEERFAYTGRALRNLTVSRRLVDLEDSIDFLVESLPKFQELERLSFVLHDRVSEAHASRNLDRIATAAEHDKWYISLGRIIGREAPRLRELVVLRGQGRIMRGLRKSDGEPMTIELVNNYDGEGDEFPYGLA